MKKYLETAISNALKTLDLLDIKGYKVEVPPEGFGDYSTNVAFFVSKRMRMSPLKAAEVIGEKLLSDPRVERISVDGPGFINIILSQEAFSEALFQTLNNRYYWRIKRPAAQKNIQIEFASVNPTGPFTVGHGRQAVIGDILAEVMRARGLHVEKEMYLNDAGRQIQLLGESVWIRYQQLLGKKVELEDTHYQGGYLVEMAEELIKEVGETYLDRSEKETRRFFRDYVLDRMVQTMKASMDKLGVSFDSFFSERTLVESGAVDRVLKTLRDKGLVTDRDGAVWFKVSAFEDESDKVLVRSDGTFTYFMTDIAYHLNKFERGFDYVIDIWGADHLGHIPRMRAAMKALGIPESFFNVMVHQYVNLKKGNEIVKMSTRRGEFYTLDELMEIVGVDATRYFFAMFDPDTHMLFDIDLARTKSAENPVFYVQYAHARICSIFRNAVEKGICHSTAEDVDYSLLQSDEERKLIREITSFPEVLERVAGDYKVSRITNFLEELASCFHIFYNKHKVIDRNHMKMSEARVGLCMVIKNLLADGLALLGVSAPESM
ncbi:MAG TPA: arginine--tRNA ligase [Kosmotogaceae bacterium]|nr:MAG: Arginine--tRNA ligase [Thermotogales bacterium 46_20]HAA86032.1 arginine--tRNA ligase [Kosmotogaceae bacterium]